MSFIIRYTKDAEGMSDFSIPKFVDAVERCFVNPAEAVNTQLHHRPNVTYLVGNLVTINALRAMLISHPFKNDVKWFVEDTEVHFDENLRSEDFWPLVLDVDFDSMQTLLNHGVQQERRKQIGKDDERADTNG